MSAPSVQTLRSTLARPRSTASPDLAGRVRLAGLGPAINLRSLDQPVTPSPPRHHTFHLAPKKMSGLGSSFSTTHADSAEEKQKPAASEQASANKEAPEEALNGAEAELEEEEPEDEKFNVGEGLKGEDCFDEMCTSPVPSIPALTGTDLAFPSPRALRIVFSPHDALLRSLRRAEALLQAALGSFFFVPRGSL
ncbi:hypothetical protein B0H14DRAFT_2650007 [Mycena olivaceomarginata]|nr:hypothetical protein B0H14DRAFT_2650007 [Mycena olivaceomarginata]